MFCTQEGLNTYSEKDKIHGRTNPVQMEKKKILLGQLFAPREESSSIQSTKSLVPSSPPPVPLQAEVPSRSPLP